VVKEASSWARVSRQAAAPMPVKGETGGDEDEAEAGFAGGIEKGEVEEEQCDEDEEDGHEGVADGAVGPGEIGAFMAEDNDGGGGHAIEDPGGEDNERGELVVAP